MKRARILLNGELTNVTVNDNLDAVLADGTVIAQADVDWQPPCDGKIFVLDVGQAVRVRTGETNQDAL